MSRTQPLLYQPSTVRIHNKEYNQNCGIGLWYAQNYILSECSTVLPEAGQYWVQLVSDIVLDAQENCLFAIRQLDNGILPQWRLTSIRVESRCQLMTLLASSKEVNLIILKDWE